MLRSDVVRGPTLSSITRALCMGVLVGGCAQIANLGNGVDATETSPPPDGVSPRTDANITISPLTLDYGSLPCGADAPAKLVTITNSGSRPANYELKLPEGTAFHLGPDAKGVLAPKGSVSVNVIANPTLAGDNGADLVVNAGEALQPVHLITKGTGPTFELAQSTVAFGEVRKENGGTPVDIAVKNSGTADLSVATFTSTDANFDVAWPAKPSAFVVKSGASSNITVTLKTAVVPDGAGLKSTIKPAITALCGASPVLVATGQRVTSDITVSPLDWGGQACGTTPVPQNVTIKNYANVGASYAIDTATTPSFDVTDMSGGTIGPATGSTAPATAIIQVAPKKLAITAPLPNTTEILGVNLTSTAPGAAGRRTATLHVDTRGAILVFTPAALTFTDYGSKSFTVSNTGNESLSFLLLWNLQGGGSSWSGSGPSFLSAGAVGNGTITYKAGGASGESTTKLAPSQTVNPKPACPSLGFVAATGNKP